MDVWDIEYRIYILLVRFGIYLSRVERKHLHIPPWLCFFSRLHPETTFLEVMIFISAPYYALIAFPVIHLVQGRLSCWWTGSKHRPKKSWKSIYAKSFELAFMHISSMWVMLILVSTLCSSAQCYETNLSKMRLAFCPPESDVFLDNVVPPPSTNIVRANEHLMSLGTTAR